MKPWPGGISYYIGHFVASETVPGGRMQPPISLTNNRLSFPRLVDSLSRLVQIAVPSSTVICDLTIVHLHTQCFNTAIWLQGYCKPRHGQSHPLPLTFQTATSYSKQFLRFRPAQVFPQSLWKSHNQNVKSAIYFSAIGEINRARKAKQTSGHCYLYQTTFMTILFYLICNP